VFFISRNIFRTSDALARAITNHVASILRIPRIGQEIINANDEEYKKSTYRSKWLINAEKVKLLFFRRTRIVFTSIILETYVKFGLNIPTAKVMKDKCPQLHALLKPRPCTSGRSAEKGQTPVWDYPHGKVFKDFHQSCPKIIYPAFSRIFHSDRSAAPTNIPVAVAICIALIDGHILQPEIQLSTFLRVKQGQQENGDGSEETPPNSDFAWQDQDNGRDGSEINWKKKAEWGLLNCPMRLIDPRPSNGSDGLPPPTPPTDPVSPATLCTFDSFHQALQALFLGVPSNIHNEPTVFMEVVEHFIAHSKKAGSEGLSSSRLELIISKMEDPFKVRNLEIQRSDCGMSSKLEEVGTSSNPDKTGDDLNSNANEGNDDDQDRMDVDALLSEEEDETGEEAADVLPSSLPATLANTAQLQQCLSLVKQAHDNLPGAASQINAEFSPLMKPSGCDTDNDDQEATFGSAEPTSLSTLKEELNALTNRARNVEGADDLVSAIVSAMAPPSLESFLSRYIPSTLVKQGANAASQLDDISKELSTWSHALDLVKTVVTLHQVEENSKGPVDVSQMLKLIPAMIRAPGNQSRTLATSHSALVTLYFEKLILTNRNDNLDALQHVRTLSDPSVIASPSAARPHSVSSTDDGSSIGNFSTQPSTSASSTSCPQPALAAIKLDNIFANNNHPTNGHKSCSSTAETQTISPGESHFSEATCTDSKPEVPPSSSQGGGRHPLSQISVKEEPAGRIMSPLPTPNVAKRTKASKKQPDQTKSRQPRRKRTRSKTPIHPREHRSYKLQFEDFNYDP